MRKHFFRALLFLLGVAFVFFQGYHLARTRWMRHWMDHQAQDMRERAECSRAIRVTNEELDHIKGWFHTKAGNRSRPHRTFSCVQFTSWGDYSEVRAVPGENCAPAVKAGTSAPMNLHYGTGVPHKTSRLFSCYLERPLPEGAAVRDMYAGPDGVCRWR